MTLRITPVLSYSELIKIDSFEDRYEYLKLPGTVGEVTFGHDRYLNQRFYQSADWKRIRREVILRDNGCDLAMPGWEIPKYAMVHHINPITIKDVLENNPLVYDMENLVCVSKRTHNAIHYGDRSLLMLNPVERHPDDTLLWKRVNYNGREYPQLNQSSCKY